MVPFVVSAFAIVRGILSPFSSKRIITKCPALRALAIKGASISSKTTFSEKCSLCTILFIFYKIMLSSKNRAKVYISNKLRIKKMVEKRKNLF